MRSSAWSRATLLLAAVWVAASACMSPMPSTEAAVPMPSRGLQDDAGPRAFSENEVDLPARPLAPVEPGYPPKLRAMGLEGEIEARVLVQADGSVGGMQLVSSSDEAFTAAARESLRQARFHPAQRAGRPVASWVTLRFRFRLE